MLESVSSISCNNDAELGEIIAEAYTKVGKDGVVLMEESPTEETYEIVDGVQIDSGLTSPHFVTDKDKQVCELDNPLVLIVGSEIASVRKIQSILEHVIKINVLYLLLLQLTNKSKLPYL